MDDAAPPAAPGMRALRYPAEVTTADGTLATVDAVVRADDARFFFGHVWPLGLKKIRTSWSRSGRAIDRPNRFDIDPSSSDVGAVLAEIARWSE